MRRLADFEPVFTHLMHLMAKDTRLRSSPPIGDLIAQHPRLMLAINHSSPLSWLPAICLLAVHFCARGGGRRKPLGVMDRFFYQVPLTRPLAEYFTQSDRPLSFFELAEHFLGLNDADLVIFPEGSNCFFGRPDEVQEFRSPRFIEIAIRAKCPILICVHKGSESWATNISVNSEFLEYLDFLPKFAVDFAERRLRKTGLLTLPLLPKPMDLFEMKCELYHPQLTIEELSQDETQKYEQIRSESEKVRQRMKEMLRELTGCNSALSSDRQLGMV